MAETKKRYVYPQSIAKYNLKVYDRIELKVKKDSECNKAAIQAHAKERGESLLKFINRAITETMARDRGE